MSVNDDRMHTHWSLISLICSPFLAFRAEMGTKFDTFLIASSRVRITFLECICFNPWEIVLVEEKIYIVLTCYFECDIWLTQCLIFWSAIQLFKLSVITGKKTWLIRETIFLCLVAASFLIYWYNDLMSQIKDFKMSRKMQKCLKDTKVI